MVHIFYYCIITACNCEASIAPGGEQFGTLFPMSSTQDTTPIAMLDLGNEVTEHWDALTDALHDVLRSGQFIGGPAVETFEKQFAEAVGTPHALGLNSGTDALVIALETLGAGPGDEVITTPFSFFATSEAIIKVGATPVFGDIDPLTCNLDSATVAPLVTERTKAIIPVHLFGLPLDLSELLALNIPIIEDCAQAFGAKRNGQLVGSFGTFGAFSFYPTKTLGAYGDGGALTMHDSDYATRVGQLRNHGSSVSEKYRHEFVGWNSRLDAFQAAILSVKLSFYEEQIRHRRQIARWYREAFARHGIAITDAEPVSNELLLPPDDSAHVYHQFVIQAAAPFRARIEQHLAAAHIACSRFYPEVLTQQPIGHDYGSAPIAERVKERTLALPIHAALTQTDVQRIAAAIQAAQ